MTHLLEAMQGPACDAKFTMSGVYDEGGIVEYHTRKKFDLMLATDNFYKFEDCAGTVFIAVEWCPVHRSAEDACNMLSEVDCPQCVSYMNKKLYYCRTHKVLSCKEVTFNERCAHCGQPC